jgi:hypothetical protein
MANSLYIHSTKRLRMAPLIPAREINNNLNNKYWGITNYVLSNNSKYEKEMIKK